MLLFKHTFHLMTSITFLYTASQVRVVQAQSARQRARLELKAKAAAANGNETKAQRLMKAAAVVEGSESSGGTNITAVAAGGGRGGPETEMKPPARGFSTDVAKPRAFKQSDLLLFFREVRVYLLSYSIIASESCFDRIKLSTVFVPQYCCMKILFFSYFIDCVLC